MSRTTPYSIPDHIQEIEESEDSLNHPDFLIKLGKRAMMYKDESIYTSLVTDMIYFEEASVSKELNKFKLNFTSLKPITNEKKSKEKSFELNNVSKIIFVLDVFRVFSNVFNVFLQENLLKKYTKAFNEKILHNFIIKSNIGESKPLGFGKLIKSDDSLIFKVMQGFDRLEMYSNKTKEVHFITNRLPYQQQHNALHWFTKHRLFDILINNPLFQYPPDELIFDDNYIFRYRKIILYFKIISIQFQFQFQVRLSIIEIIFFLDYFTHYY